MQRFFQTWAACASKCQQRSALFYAKEHIFSENIKAFPMKF